MQKHIIDINDTVRVTNSGKRYTTYHAWINARCPHLKDKYVESSRHYVLSEERFTVIVRGWHGSNISQPLYLIENDMFLVLIDNDGVERVNDNNQINVGDAVRFLPLVDIGLVRRYVKGNDDVTQLLFEGVSLHGATVANILPDGKNLLIKFKGGKENNEFMYICPWDLLTRDTSVVSVSATNDWL